MPICTRCGQETSFIPQYQQWYCHNCQMYPYLQQAAAPLYQYQQPAYQGHYYQQSAYYQQYQTPPVQYQQPVVGPNPVSARNKMYGSFMMRQSSDKAIPTAWVWIILMFQIILPFSAVIAIYALLLGTNLDFSSIGIFVAIILAVLLVSIALAISHAVLIYKLVKRRDEHFRRDTLLRDGMSEYLGAVSLNTGVDLNVERWTMYTLHYMSPYQERSAALWGVLVALIPLIPIVGIIFLVYSQAFLTKDVQEHDERQRQFNHHYQVGLAKAGKTGDTAFVWQPLPRRKIAVYVVLTILTFGLFLPYWWYVNIVDMNTHMANQWKFENALVQRIQADG